MYSYWQVFVYETYVAWYSRYVERSLKSGSPVMKSELFFLIKRGTKMFEIGVDVNRVGVVWCIHIIGLLCQKWEISFIISKSQPLVQSHLQLKVLLWSSLRYPMHLRAQKWEQFAAWCDQKTLQTKEFPKNNWHSHHPVTIQWGWGMTNLVANGSFPHYSISWHFTKLYFRSMFLSLM